MLFRSVSQSRYSNFRYELTLTTSENYGLDLIETWHNKTFEQIQNDLKVKQFVKLKDYNQIKIKFD